MENPTSERFQARSESVVELMSALAKAKAGFLPVLRTKKAGGERKPYMYAPLENVIEAITPSLLTNSLVLSDDMCDGYLVVTLDHAPSGQWKRSRLPIPDPGKVGWQEFGSATTYARRYLYSPMVGLASEEDDDAAAADGKANGPDPLQPLWDALDKTDIPSRGPTAVRDWCEIVLGRPVPHPNTIFAKDLPMLMAALAHDTAKPAEKQATPAAAPEADKVKLAKELNTALTTLAPWGKLVEGKTANEAVEYKKAVKIRWANGMRPNGKPIASFGQLSVAELLVLIEKAKAGEVPSMGAEDDMPDWTEEAEATEARREEVTK